MNPYIPKIGDRVRIKSCSYNPRGHNGKVGKITYIGILYYVDLGNSGECHAATEVASLSRRGVNDRTMQRNAKGQFAKDTCTSRNITWEILPQELTINGVVYVRK